VIIGQGRPPRDPDPSVEMEATFLWSRLSAAEARRFVTDTLVTWGCDDRVDDATLLASELATNALLHARTGFTVGLSHRPDGSIRVSVRDTGIGRPRPRPAGPLDGSGRGLAMVEALATEWGADLSPGGKVVWADLRAVSGR
jgi:anti-sigma regulatory factor (Ser/Thr protein kinase)